MGRLKTVLLALALPGVLSGCEYAMGAVVYGINTQTERIALYRYQGKEVEGQVVYVLPPEQWGKYYERERSAFYREAYANGYSVGTFAFIGNGGSELRFPIYLNPQERIQPGDRVRARIHVPYSNEPMDFASGAFTKVVALVRRGKA